MDAIRHLSVDPVLRGIIGRVGTLQVRRRPNVCYFLCRSVVSQQLSTKVAQVIEARLSQLLPAGPVTPEAILTLSVPQLRKIGLSATKSDYILNIARFFSELSLTDATFSRMEDESVIELLTQIKGVGRWTAEMTLMFSLGRKDVFPKDDYGIQQAMIRLYGLPSTSGSTLKSEMERIASSWAPYRTYASLYLWRHRDNQG